MEIAGSVFFTKVTLQLFFCWLPYTDGMAGKPFDKEIRRILLTPQLKLQIRFGTSCFCLESLANKEISQVHLRTIHHFATPFDDPGMVVDLVKLLIISFALAGAIAVPLFLLHTIYRAIRGIRAQ